MMSGMEYVLKRTGRSASIRISLNHEGDVLVTAPTLAPRFMIDRFVSQNHDWIERQQRRLLLRKSANPNLDWSEGLLSYLGRLYSIKVVDSSGQKVEFSNGICYVRPVTGVAADGKKTLLAWLKIQAEKYILERVMYWSEIMSTSFGTVRFGQQSSRWGSCSGENNLRFNWRLIHFPKEIIDYVVIHELAHTVHHDHSSAFWGVVNTYCPSWKEQRRFLKRQAVSIEKM
jgi:predicted metal-dependent hydrolase